MKPQSHFELNLFGRRLTGFWAGVMGVLIAIPVLAVVGLLLFFILSLAGVVITIGLTIAGIGLIIALLSLLLPKKWRDKLGIRFNVSHTRTGYSKKTKHDTTPDGKPIIDVDFEEED